MSLLNNNNNKQKGKQAKKNQPTNQGSKFLSKPSKGSGMTQKPHKAGGTRGS